MLSGSKRPGGVERFLAPSEKVIHLCRRHPVALAKPFLAWLVTLFAAATFGFLVSPRTDGSIADSIAGWIVLIVTGFSGVSAVSWWKASYVITDQRVLLIEGIVSVRVRAIPLEKVTDTTFSRSVWGRLFGYGDLLLDSPGEQPGLSTLTDMPHPEALYRLITSLVVGRVWQRREQSQHRVFEDDDTGPLPRVII